MKTPSYAEMERRYIYGHLWSLMVIPGCRQAGVKAGQVLLSLMVIRQKPDKFDCIRRMAIGSGHKVLSVPS
jgi:hypothetical protein